MKIVKTKILKMSLTKNVLTMTKTRMMITRYLHSCNKTACAPYKTSQESQAVGSCWTVNWLLNCSPTRDFWSIFKTRGGHWTCTLMLEGQLLLGKGNWRAIEQFGTSLRELQTLCLWEMSKCSTRSHMTVLWRHYSCSTWHMALTMFHALQKGFSFSHVKKQHCIFHD